MKSSFRRFFLTIITLLALTFGLTGVTPVSAATLIVTNVNDSGAGSLRDAIASATDGDTITFDPSLAGQTIYLQASLSIGQIITIDGSALAEKITLSGDSDKDGTGDVQVMNISTAYSPYSYYPITLNSLRITKGLAARGGGIYNYGTLTIINSTISDNYAFTSSYSSSYEGGGGIYNDGILTVTNSTVSGNSASSSSYPDMDGGGIYNQGKLSITNSIFSDNSADYGGGIFNGTTHGTTTIMHSTFSGNSAGAGGAIFDIGGAVVVADSIFSGNAANDSMHGYGGGIFNGETLNVTNSVFSGNSAPQGGGIFNWSQLNVTNSTFSSNSAHQGGSIFNRNNGTATVINSTLSDNSASFGGGIFNDNLATLNYANTIIANASAGGDCDNSNGGTIGVNLNNLVEDGGCAAALGGDPLLGPLTDNGGSTQTFALLEGSSAIDAGDDTVCTAAPVNNTSQNGLLRPQRAHCDIGAYEAPALPTATPTVTETSTATETATITVSPTVTLTATETTTLTPTVTNTSTATATLTPTVTNTVTATATFTPTITKTVTKTVTRTPTKTPVTITLVSSAAQDGWVLESGETSEAGGTLNSASGTFSLGDDAAKRQYRGVLSFQTGAGIPDNATITAVTLKVKQQGIIGGGNPVSSLQGFMVDIQNGFFGTFAALQPLDFQSTASGSYGPFVFSPAGNVYSINLTAGKSFINKLAVNSGLTQIRLRFKLDDNNNTVANMLNLYSGDAVNAVDRPQLVITYTVP